jgi:hypothetical protein
MISKTFCVNPWVTLHAKILDGYNPCCLFEKTIQANTVQEYVHSPELKSIKDRMLAGEKISECSRCWKQEQTGHVSKRQRDNKTYSKIFQALNQDLDVPHGKFVEYYIRLGNHCNLRCTTCNDTLSSGWISENKKFNISSQPVTLIPDNHDVWDHIKSNANTIGAIEFIGGEPFMMSVDIQSDLLKWLVDHGHAKRIRIKYNTNGTRLPTEQLEYWPAFKAIEMNVSVDGIGKRFEYLRFPAKWQEVDATIKYFQELQKIIPQLELTIINTVSILNIGYTDEILNYCKDSDLNIFMNMLESPDVLNLYNFNSNVKSWIVSRIQHINHPVITNILNNLNQTTSNMNGKMLLNFLAPLDQRRNLNVKNTFSELVEFLDHNK